MAMGEMKRLVSKERKYTGIDVGKNVKNKEIARQK